MKYALYIFIIVLSGICYGKPIDRKVEKLPVDIQKHVDAMKDAAKSNDWQSVREEYDKIDMRQVSNPISVLREASDVLKKSKNKDAKILRKEIKTKYELLREVSDPELDDDIETIPVPIVQFTVHRFPPMKIDQVELVTIGILSLHIPGLRYVYLDINGIPCPTLDFNTIVIPGLKYTYMDLMVLDPEVLKALGIMVPVVDSKGVSVVVLKIKDEKFIALMELWERRYNKQIDFYDERGNRIVPMPGTVLWGERRAVIKAVEKGGDYDALWDTYNENMRKAIGRRINLKRK